MTSQHIYIEEDKGIWNVFHKLQFYFTRQNIFLNSKKKGKKNKGNLGHSSIFIMSEGDRLNRAADITANTTKTRRAHIVVSLLLLC